MNSITVDVDKVLNTLRENRDAHRAIFEEALEGYRSVVIDTLEQQLARAKAGKKINAYIQFSQPEDHTSDYDRVIRMLEWTTDHEITLSEHDFAQYVLNDWKWQQQFLTSNSAYSMTAAKALESQP